jgi:hypothetical protein
VIFTQEINERDQIAVQTPGGTFAVSYIEPIGQAPAKLVFTPPPDFEADVNPHETSIIVRLAPRADQ